MTKKSKKSSFRDKVTGNAHKQKSQGAQYGYLSLPKGVNVFKETPGSRAHLDILPYVITDPKHPDRDEETGTAIPGELWYKRPYKLHRNVGVNNDSDVCPAGSGKKCPICEYRAKLLRDGANWQDDAVRATKASNRNLYVVIPKKQKEYEEKPHVWDISQFCFQDKLNDELDEEEEYGTFPDLEEGMTLRIRFSEEQLGKNKFADTSRIDFQERDKPYDESILKEVPNLDEFLQCLSYKQLEAKFYELDDELEPEENVTEDKPAPDKNEEKSSSRTRTRKTTEKSDTSQETEKTTTQKNKCPHSHQFGVDCDEYDECEDCELWEDCLDAKEEMEETEK